jgi:hypothetical protein
MTLFTVRTLELEEKGRKGYMDGTEWVYHGYIGIGV